MEVLVDSGGISQAEIARRSGLAPATVSNIVRELTEAGILELAAVASGRRGNTVAFSPSIGYGLGIFLDQDHVRMGLATLDHTPVDQGEADLDPAWGPRRALAETRRACLDMLSARSISPSQVRAACITVPSAVTPAGRLAAGSMGLPGWSGADLAAISREIFDTHISVENDANAGALAEHMWGRGKGVDNLVYVEASRGLGAGLVIGGSLHRGVDGLAGEIGHLAVPSGTELCHCGDYGCLETVASVTALMKAIRQISPGIQSWDDLLTGAQNGNRHCERQLTRAGWAIGEALAQTCSLLNPQLVILGGILAEAGDLVLTPLQTVLGQRIFPDTLASLTLDTSVLGRQAVLRGAVARAVNMVDLDEVLLTGAGVI